MKRSQMQNQSYEQIVKEVFSRINKTLVLHNMPFMLSVFAFVSQEHTVNSFQKRYSINKEGLKCLKILHLSVYARYFLFLEL